MVTKVYSNCPCCRSSSSSSSSSRRSSSSSSSSSSFVCPACQNCLAIDFGSGVVSTVAGCVGTFTGQIDAVTPFIMNQTIITNAPTCTRYTFGPSPLSGQIKLDTNPPTVLITFACGSAPQDVATYTKTDTNSCILGDYSLTSRSQPSKPLTWPSSLAIFSTTQFIPASPPSSFTITWDASIADSGAVTSVSVPVTYTANTELGKITSTFTGGAGFISKPATIFTNDWGAAISFDCRVGLFFRLQSNFQINPVRWTGDTSFVLSSGGNPSRMWPTSGSVFTCNIPNMVPRVFASGVTSGDFTITY